LGSQRRAWLVLTRCSRLQPVRASIGAVNEDRVHRDSLPRLRPHGCLLAGGASLRAASRRKTAGWFSVTQRTKVPISRSRVAIGVPAAGVGFISTSIPRTSKPKLSDWSLWERGDIPGGIVLKTTSLCLRTLEAPSSASCRRPTRHAIRAAADIRGRRPAMARDMGR